MIVTINRTPSWATISTLPVGAVINLPEALANPLIAAGEAVPTPGAAITHTDPFGSSGGGGGSGGGSGGGGDRVSVVLEADPVNVGQQRVLRETFAGEGIPWTLSYDAFGRVIKREWAAGGLVANIAYDAYGYGTATGNVYNAQGEIETTSSQMPTLKSALTALALTTQTPRFHVNGLDITVEWAANRSAFRFPRGLGTISYQFNAPAVADPGAAETAALFTATLPGWLRAPGAEYRVFTRYNSPNYDSLTKSYRIRINGSIEWQRISAIAATVTEYQLDAAAREVTAGTVSVWGLSAGVGPSTSYSSSGSTNHSIAADTDITITTTVQYASDPTAAATGISGQTFLLEHRLH